MTKHGAGRDLNQNQSGVAVFHAVWGVLGVSGLGGFASVVGGCARVSLLTLQNVYVILRKSVAVAGGQTAFADEHGISTSYVCDVLNARRDPGTKILSALGLKRVMRFEKIGDLDA